MPPLDAVGKDDWITAPTSTSAASKDDWVTAPVASSTSAGAVDEYGRAPPPVSIGDRGAVGRVVEAGIQGAKEGFGDPGTMLTPEAQAWLDEKQHAGGASGFLAKLGSTVAEDVGTAGGVLAGIPGAAFRGAQGAAAQVGRELPAPSLGAAGEGTGGVGGYLRESLSSLADPALAARDVAAAPEAFAGSPDLLAPTRVAEPGVKPPAEPLETPQTRLLRQTEAAILRRVDGDETRLTAAEKTRLTNLREKLVPTTIADIGAAPDLETAISAAARASQASPEVAEAAAAAVLPDTASKAPGASGGGANGLTPEAFKAAETSWRNQLTSNEDNHVRLMLTGPAFSQEINAALRKGKTPFETSLIDDALDKGHTLDAPFVGYRGLSRPITTGEVTDPGYGFIMREAADAAQYGPHIYQVTVPAGTVVGPSISPRGRAEVIVPRNTRLTYQDINATPTATVSAPESVGAAASRQGTPAAVIDAVTPAQKATALQKMVTQSAEDRLTPGGRDDNIYVKGVERPESMKDFSPATEPGTASAALTHKTLHNTESDYHDAFDAQVKKNNIVMVDKLGDLIGDANSREAAMDDAKALMPGSVKLFDDQQPVNAQPIVDTIKNILASPAGKTDAVINTLNSILPKLYEGNDIGGKLETLPSMLKGVRDNITHKLYDKTPTVEGNAARTARNQLLDVRSVIDQTISEGIPGTKYQDYLANLSAALAQVAKQDFLQRYLTGSKKLTDLAGNLLFNKVQRLLEDIQAHHADPTGGAKELTMSEINQIEAIRNELAAKDLLDRRASVRGSPTTQLTNASGILGTGPLGTVVRGGGELALHGALAATTHGVGNAVLGGYRLFVKPQMDLAKQRQAAAEMAATKARLLDTTPQSNAAP